MACTRLPAPYTGLPELQHPCHDRTLIDADSRTYVCCRLMCSYTSVMTRCRLIWWCLVPRVSIRAEVMGIIEQPVHVGDIEFLVVRIIKVRPDVRQLKSA